VRHPDHDLSGYDLIVAPAIMLMSAERAAHLASYAGDARLVFGPRTAFRTPSGRVQEDGQPGPLKSLVGHALVNYDGMRPGMSVQVGDHRIETWAESYRPLGDATRTLRAYTSGPLAGQPAVVRNGNAISIGAWSEDLVREIVREVCAEIGIPTADLPAGVRVSRRGATEVWMNFNQEAVTLADGRTLEPVSFQFRG